MSANTPDISNSEVKKRLVVVEENVQKIDKNIRHFAQKVQTDMEGSFREVMTLVVLSSALKNVLIDKAVITQIEMDKVEADLGDNKDLFALSQMGPFAVKSASYKLEAIANLLTAKSITTEDEIFAKAQEVEKKVAAHIESTQKLAAAAKTMNDAKRQINLLSAREGALNVKPERTPEEENDLANVKQAIAAQNELIANTEKEVKELQEFLQTKAV